MEALYKGVDKKELDNNEALTKQATEAVNTWAYLLNDNYLQWRDQVNDAVKAGSLTETMDEPGMGPVAISNMFLQGLGYQIKEVRDVVVVGAGKLDKDANAEPFNYDDYNKAVKTYTDASLKIMGGFQQFLNFWDKKVALKTEASINLKVAKFQAAMDRVVHAQKNLPGIAHRVGAV